MTIDDQLERCKPWINAALEYSGGTHLFEDVVDSVKLGTMQLWAGERGCLVTEIIQYPRKKVLHIFLAGGELDQILDMDASVQYFGRANGCTSMTLAGRRGWVRALSHLSWKEQFTVVGVEI